MIIHGYNENIQINDVDDWHCFGNFNYRSVPDNRN